MPWLNLLIGLSNLVSAAVCALVALPLIRRRVGRNGVMGFRFPASLDSDEAWYEVNAYGGRRLLWWSGVLALIGIASLFVPLEGRFLRTLLFGSAPMIYLVPWIEAYRYANRLKG